MSLMTQEEYALHETWPCEHECSRCQRVFLHDAGFGDGSGCEYGEPVEGMLCASCEQDSAECLPDCPNRQRESNAHLAACDPGPASDETDITW